MSSALRYFRTFGRFDDRAHRGLATRSVRQSQLAACGGIRVGVGAGLEFYPKGRAPQLESLAEKTFQIAAVGVGHARERRAVDDDARRIHAALVRIAQLL